MKKTIKRVGAKDKVVYTATIQVLGRTYTAQGDSVKDAISKLKPKNCKGRGVLVVSWDDRRMEKILMPAVVFRLFNTGGLSREIAIKNASLLFL